MRVVKAAALYFALVFGAGFVLGVVRLLWLVPRLGERAAELAEMPVMLVVIVAAAWWVTRRLAVPRNAAARLAMGVLALVFLLAVEFTVVLWLRGLPLEQYFATRDPVAGAVYYALLGVFAAMPALLARR